MPDPTLAELTTLRLGGPATRYVAAPDADALVAAVSEADAAGEPVLLVGGGSNLVVADEGFAGTVVHLTGGGVHVDDDACGVTTVTVAAGEPWDDFVARAVADDGSPWNPTARPPKSTASLLALARSR